MPYFDNDVALLGRREAVPTVYVGGKYAKEDSDRLKLCFKGLEALFAAFFGGLARPMLTYRRRGMLSARAWTVEKV